MSAENHHGEWLRWGSPEAVAHMAARLAELPGYDEAKARQQAERRHADRTGQPLDFVERCSYCGGIHPDAFWEAIENGYAMEVADWKYGWPHKIYVDWPNPRPDELRLTGSTSEGSEPRYDEATGQPTHRVKTTEEPPNDRYTVWSDEHGWSCEGTYPTVQLKFYTTHLGDWPRSTELPVRVAIWQRTGIDFVPKDGDSPGVMWRRAHPETPMPEADVVPLDRGPSLDDDASAGTLSGD